MFGMRAAGYGVDVSVCFGLGDCGGISGIWDEPLRGEGRLALNGQGAGCVTSM